MRLLVLLALFGGASGCIIPSNVVAPEDRGVQTAENELVWGPASEGDISGFYASESIDGPMAGVLLRVFYLFGSEGAYTGAALIDGSPPSFQVLSGSWSFADGSLQLDDADPARAERAGNRLRLSGPDGQIILVRQGSL